MSLSHINGLTGFVDSERNNVRFGVTRSSSWMYYFLSIWIKSSSSTLIKFVPNSTKLTQIVRTDLKKLVDLDLHGAPYGYTPMCDSRAEVEGFRFWKQGFWKDWLKGLPYHIRFVLASIALTTVLCTLWISNDSDKLPLAIVCVGPIKP
jgi:hypothetical protein